MRRVAVTALTAGLLATSAPAGIAQDDDCPNASAPPPPVDTSEVPPPGEPSPEPLEVPTDPVGGQTLGECGLVSPEGAPEPPGQVSAESWTLADLDTGEVVAAQDPHARHRPASTIKVLTALVALRDLKLDDRIEVSQEDADQEGTRVGLEPGVTYTVEQVVRGLLMQSGNDAAHALASRVGGVDAMVDRMNATARELGAKDTRTASPSGLDGPGMSTSSYDLALIFREAMREPTFADAVRSEHLVLPAGPDEPPLEVWNDNKLLYNYEGALGGKTGFTDDAQHTYIGAAEKDGRRLVAVLMRGQHQPVHQSQQATELLEYGFGIQGGVGELVTEDPDKPKTTEPPPVTNASDATPPVEETGWGAGTVGLPLGVLLLAAVAVAGTLTYRKRAASAPPRGPDDDHP
nr:D-alanyl-D-alanine carboxypeptidase family protein [Saccharopolyspora sp. HNM0983]